MRRLTAISALTALAATACSGAPEPTPPPDDDLEELLDTAMFDVTDASADSAAREERLRALQARLEKLKARVEAQKARLAVLKDEAAKRRAHHVEQMSIPENFAMAAIAVMLAAIVSRRRNGPP